MIMMITLRVKNNGDDYYSTEPHSEQGVSEAEVLDTASNGL